MSLKYALNFRRAWLTPTPQGRGSGAMRFDPAAVTPDVHIFTRSKLPWLAWPMGARAFEAFYKIDQVCPPESLARWRELAAISS